MWFVYVLRSQKDGKFYIGSTGDIKRRLLQHNQGRSTSTRHRRPFEIVYTEAYNTEQEAVRREVKIKSYKGGAAFKKLLAE